MDGAGKPLPHLPRRMPRGYKRKKEGIHIGIRIRTWLVISLSLLFILISIQPMYHMGREYSIGSQVVDRYEVAHAYERDGWPMTLDAKEIQVGGLHIEIVEEDTGRDAPQTWHDQNENVPGGDIITVQLKVNGESVNTPVEMWLSNRDRGSRYYSWLDVLTVLDKNTGEQSVAIVQRLTDDLSPMDDRQWRITFVLDDGTWRDEVLTYRERSKSHLGVRLVNMSGTARMGMGFYSDILQGYPSLIFPLLYPWGTSAFGLLLLLIGAAMVVRDRRMRNMRS